MGKDLDAMFREVGGVEEPPPGLTIPLLPISWRDKVSIFLHGIRLQWRERAALRSLPRFLAENSAWCADMRHRAGSAETAQKLVQLWPEMEAHSTTAFWTAVGTVWQYAEVVAPLRRELTGLVGEEDASALLSNVSTEGALLASLGPVVGLSRVAAGRMTRQAYLEQYGHRGPDEVEFAAPRPAEDPSWLDRQLDLLAESPAGATRDAEEMLARQRARFDAAWANFQQCFPGRAETIQGRLAVAAKISRDREAARSELTRQLWPGRVWALRAGALTGLNDDVFYLTIGEVLDLLSGRPAPVETIPTRRETNARYRALPPYPPLISGQFDPFAWAADADRRHDIFDSHRPDLFAARQAGPGPAIKGIAGSAGRVEGRVRRIDSPEGGDQLQPGEILVTSQTNVGWTLLFPRAAAVVTDIGAPLSHAAIVARELGIPAVVGCGDATARLKNGDRVRVNGATGVVELLNSDAPRHHETL
jgi:pyruvate,water dikinase